MSYKKLLVRMRSLLSYILIFAFATFFQQVSSGKSSIMHYKLSLSFLYCNYYIELLEMSSFYFKITVLNLAMELEVLQRN